MKPRFFTVLCEDLQAFVFIRRALIEAGAEGRNIRARPCPDSSFNAAGGGSPRAVNDYTVYACGSQHVRMNYPGELQSVRVQHAKRDSALVVHIDVDNQLPSGRTVQDRFQELDVGCASAGVPVRGPGDPVSILVPRREIETWLEFFLAGTLVDEHTQYRKLSDRESDCQPAAEAFLTHARANTIPPKAPPSLVRGLQEFRRVL